MERRSDRHTYTKPIGLDTMSLLIRFPFFGETGPEDGELAIGGETLPRRELLGPGKSHIADQLPLLEQDQRFPPTKIERAMVSELALVDRKSLCVKECLHVMYQVVAHRRSGESDQAGKKEDVD